MKYMAARKPPLGLLGVARSLAPGYTKAVRAKDESVSSSARYKANDC